MTYYEQHNIQVGRHTYGEPICKGNANKVTIGSFCSIGSNVVLDRGFNHKTDNISTFPFHTLYPEIPSNVGEVNDIFIGNDVWICDDVTILNGVNISDGAIVGSKSLVTKDTEIGPYEVWGGVPAKFIKTRFFNSDIYKLLRLAWWDKSEEEIKEIAPLLASNQLDKLFKLYNL